ncbi:MAG: PAS domain S-box protein [Ignavibacteriaceae bacterium]
MEKKSNTSSSSYFPTEGFLKESLTWENLFAMLPDAFLCVDEEGKIICVNRKAEELFGYTSDELNGQNIEMLISVNLREKHIKHREGYTKNPSSRTMGSGLKLNGLRKNGTEFPTDISLSYSIISNKLVVYCSIRDITNIINTERKLFEKEIQFQQTIKDIDEIIYSVKIEEYPNKSKVQFVTGKVEEILGITPEEFTNDLGLWISLIHPDDVLAVVEETNNLLKEKKRINREYRMKNKKSNSYIWIEDRVSPELNESGKVIGLFGIARDITERKSAIEQLKIQGVILENIHDAVIVTDLNWKITYWNKGAEKIFGYTAEETLGKTPQFLYAPDPAVDFNAYLAIIRSGKTFRNEWKGIRKDKSLIWLDTMRELMKNSKEESIGFIGISKDITDHKIAEEEIKKLSLAIEQSPVSVMITDLIGNIEYVNPKFCQITGYTFEEVKGKNPKILKSGKNDPKIYQELWQSITSGNQWRGELINMKKNGELYWESSIVSPLKNPGGDITNLIAINEDITERKRSEAELIAAKEKAEEMNKLKSIFLANMSHELRTPMIGILGYADIIKDEVTDPNILEMIDTMHQSGNRLMETLNLILNLSRIEANKLDVHLKDINAAPVIREVIKFFEPSAAKKNLYFNLFLEEEKLNFFSDEKILWEILNNLINNAVKFTKEGGITVRAKKDLLGIKPSIIIIVEDTGIGIPENMLDIIFEGFRQVSEGNSRSFEGSGLGLTIVKKFVDALKGSISVKSTLGKGSSFTVTLPFLNNEPKQKEITLGIKTEVDQPKEPTSSLPDILFVDDDKVSRDILRLFTRNYVNLEFAEDGLTAINKTKEKKYAAVFMDVSLGGGIDGLETIEQIKKNPGYQNIPILALTALAMVGDKEKFLRSGCSHYLSKPFTKQQILDVVTEMLSGLQLSS